MTVTGTRFKSNLISKFGVIGHVIYPLVWVGILAIVIPYAIVVFIKNIIN